MYCLSGETAKKLQVRRKITTCDGSNTRRNVNDEPFFDEVQFLFSLSTHTKLFFSTVIAGITWRNFVKSTRIWNLCSIHVSLYLKKNCNNKLLTDLNMSTSCCLWRSKSSTSIFTCRNISRCCLSICCNLAWKDINSLTLLHNWVTRK